jgi:PKHD-type hydroxylase
MIAVPIFNIDLTEQIHTANFTPLLNPEQCAKIIEDFSSEKPLNAKVDRKVDNYKKRDTLVHPVPHTAESNWIHELIVDRVARCNMAVYDFNVSGIYSDLQLLEYNEGGHYDWHMDIGPGQAAHRKLSVIIQLSDPKDYEGGEVLFKASEVERQLPIDQGQIGIFPSFILHKVNPVTSGKRYALVAWVSGPERFK